MKICYRIYRKVRKQAFRESLRGSYRSTVQQYFGHPSGGHFGLRMVLNSYIYAD